MVRGAAGRVGTTARSLAGPAQAQRPWQTPPVTFDPAQAAPAARPDRPRPAAGYAVLLGTLALMWGSSYLFIKIGVETLPPRRLVLLRPELAVVGSSLAYGIGNTYARRNLRAARPLVLATGPVASAVLLVGLLTLVVDGGVTLPAVPEAALSVLWLGAIGTGFAYLVFFRLLTGWGPTRASLVAFLMPVVAVILGVVVLGETIDAQLAAGGALIVAGVWVVNRNG